MADRVGHRQHGQAEGERDAEQADADLGKCRRRSPRCRSPPKHQPERADRLGGVFLDIHGSPLPAACECGDGILTRRLTICQIGDGS